MRGHLSRNREELDGRGGLHELCTYPKRKKIEVGNESRKEKSVKHH